MHDFKADMCEIRLLHTCYIYNIYTVGPRYNTDVGVYKLSTVLLVDYEARPSTVINVSGNCFIIC